METHHPDRNEKCEEEDRLVKRLKLACDKDNIEDLKESSQALHGMAKLYAANTEHKKLSYVRSAALFNAAIIRDKENTEIKRNLDSLCITALKVARAEMENENLFEFSKEVKQKLESYRNRLKSVELPLIPDNVEGEELVALQKQKIASVKKMQDGITANYTELMKYVSDKCEKIMGKPPCKYTVVGMGSLARAQITLHSDFEHVIVLDDKVGNMRKQKRKKVMRYFRWFTTIFHIIVINLQETIIPAVAIPTLNGEKEDWFYDSIFPRGVCFDSMLPQTSKMPLGRQQPTKNKPWKTELIKPAAEMLKYLDSEVDMKQGYHLADVLSKTCYVAGDQSLYKDFEQRVISVVVKNDKSSEFKQIKKQVNEDLNSLMIGIQFENLRYNAANNNIKRLIYRNATLFIAALGRLHSIQESSSFDILDRLKDIGFFDEETTHKLKFMVAVALEIRFKMYMKYGKQEDVISGFDFRNMKALVSNLMELVGKESLIQFVTTAVWLTGNFWSTDSSLFINRITTLISRVLALGMLKMNEEFKNTFMSFVEDEENVREESLNIALTFVRDVMPNTSMFEDHPDISLMFARKVLKCCKDEEGKFVAKAFILYCLIRKGDINNEAEIIIKQMHDIIKGGRLVCKKTNKKVFFTCWWAMCRYANALLRMKEYELSLDVVEHLLQLNHLNPDYASNWECGYTLFIQAKALFCLKYFSDAASVLNNFLSNQAKPVNNFKPLCYFLMAICHFCLKNFVESFLCNAQAICEDIATDEQKVQGIRKNTVLGFYFMKQKLLKEESNDVLDAQWGILCSIMYDVGLNLIQK
ncbi:uncharacterized protein LOC144747088 [Ciona intestinalis]